MTNKTNSSSLSIRIYIEDTDVGGVVYYANYLKFLERGRTEYFRDKAFELRNSFESDISYVVHSLNIKYLSPAKLDDLISVNTQVTSFGKTFMNFKQDIFGPDSQLLVSADVKVACVTLSTGKPKRLDERVIDCIRQYSSLESLD